MSKYNLGGAGSKMFDDGTFVLHALRLVDESGEYTVFDTDEVTQISANGLMSNNALFCSNNSVALGESTQAGRKNFKILGMYNNTDNILILDSVEGITEGDQFTIAIDQSYETHVGELPWVSVEVNTINTVNNTVTLTIPINIEYLESAAPLTEYSLIPEDVTSDIGTTSDIITNAFASGYACKALGYASFATGYRTTASGNYAHAEGGFCESDAGPIASGEASHAEGRETTASGNGAHAEGVYTTASGDSGAHAEGYSTTASREFSHAEGNMTTASGAASHAEGFETTAAGQNSHAEGVHTTASGESTHAEGKNTTASGYGVHAEGVGTKASGNYSHAEGNYTTASGTSSHAEGSATTASGNNAHAEGYKTIASGNYSHAEGKCNIADTEHKYAHIVGNGTEEYDAEGTLVTTRSNAHTLDWDGNAWFAGTVTCTNTIIKSSTAGSTKLFKITVDDSGTLSAVEYTV